MNNNWKQYKFSDFAEINPKISLGSSTVYPFIEMKNLSAIRRYCHPNQTKKLTGGSRFQNGDTLFARITPCLENGKINQAEIANSGVGFGSTEFLVLRGKENISDSNFVFYLSRWSEVRNHAELNFSGSTGRQRVPKEAFDTLILNLPSLDIQRNIVQVLGTLDKKIDLLISQNKILEELVKIYFEDLFGTVSNENLKLLNDYVVFDPVEKIDRTKSFRFFDMRTLSEDTMSVSKGIHRIVGSATSFRNYDTLLAKITPCLENGKTGFIMNLEDHEVARGSTEFIVMRSKGIVSPYWIYCLARSKSFRDKAIQSMTGTSGRQRVQVSQLKNLEIYFDQENMTAFHNLCSSLFNKVATNSRQIDTLIDLRDSLLPKLLSGEFELN